MRSGSYPRREQLPPGPSHSARRAITASLPTVLVLILLPAIAFASPPDPSWVAGIYDGADGDDVVSLVYETSAAHAAALSHPGPLPCVRGISLEGIVHAVRGRRFTRGPRSPPVVSSTEFGYAFSSLPPPPSSAEDLVTLPSNTKSPVLNYAVRLSGISGQVPVLAPEVSLLGEELGRLKPDAGAARPE